MCGETALSLTMVRELPILAIGLPSRQRTVVPWNVVSLFGSVGRGVIEYATPTMQIVASVPIPSVARTTFHDGTYRRQPVFPERSHHRSRPPPSPPPPERLCPGAPRRGPVGRTGWSERRPTGACGRVWGTGRSDPYPYSRP